MTPRKTNLMTSSLGKDGTRPDRWRELDFLRAQAACLMIATHLGVDSPAVEISRSVRTMVFLGSFAPVVFFFLTGLGYGVQSTGTKRPRGQDYLIKVGILLLADAFMWIKPGTYVGNDFLGFIGLSMLLLDWIRRLPRGMSLAAVLGLLLVVVRFALGPLFRSPPGSESASSLPEFLIGISSMESFSFPPCPWLSYPLFGYVLGRTVSLQREVLTSRRSSVLAGLFGLSAVTILGTAALAARGGILFRYGTMSFAYYLASFAVLAICLALSLVVCRRQAIKPLIDLISLGGIRSLTIVPLHYLYIDGVHDVYGPMTSQHDYLAFTILGVLVCFVGSAALPWLGSKLDAWGWSAKVMLVTWLAVAVAVLILWSGVPTVVPESLLRSGGQLALCLLFVLSPRSSSRNSGWAGNQARLAAATR
jgi:hypothetical protein